MYLYPLTDTITEDNGTCNLYLYRTSIYLGMHVYVQGNYKKAVCL